METTVTVNSLPSDRSARASEADVWEMANAAVWAQQAKHVQMALKRALDLLVASIALLVLSIPMTVVMIAIRLESRGPVLFAQERIGYRGIPFRMYKFRSMAVDAEARRSGLMGRNEAAAPLFKLRDDPRRTRVGKILRRFSIDEVPQLFNVLQGHMSLVGPRPALMEEAGGTLHGYHAHRVLAVPGMTGLWQVSGRSLLSSEETVAMDLRYALDWSLWLDIRILARTFPVVVTGRGAF